MNSIIKNFAPSWPSVVMGTGIVPVALAVSAPFFPGSKLLGTAIFVLSIALFAVVLILTIARLVLAREEFAKDMRHPVSGNFVPTLPIAAMVLAIDFMLIGPRLMEAHVAHGIALSLFIVGTFGIYALGLAATAMIFSNTNVQLAQTTFGWFIPPVSQLIVPVVGFDLAIAYGGTPLSMTLFVISVMSLGIGLTLFLLVGPNVYHRYLYHELPGSMMAPTAMIGLAPTAILAIILVKLATLAVAPASPWPYPGFTEVARFLSLAAWGFSAWWFVLASILIIGHLKAATADFSLSWWALSFPVGALAIATGAINKLFHLGAFTWIAAALTLLLIAIWGFVALGTIRIIANGSAFKKHEIDKAVSTR
ncbi:MAG: hypothetical protein JXM71_07385 [Spirochaetales bacterium]|nr:hypothetical protein [Spirochaetales bacterium]